MTTHVNISEAEHRVIQVLWDNGPLSAEDVADALATQSDWSFATIKTLLGRLLKKKAISAHASGRRFIYEAIMRQSDYLSTESNRLIDRLFDGQIAPLVSQFSQTKGLSKADVKALRKILDEQS